MSFMELHQAYRAADKSRVASEIRYQAAIKAWQASQDESVLPELTAASIEKEASWNAYLYARREAGLG